MEKLKGSQKKYLRGLAHSLKPLVTIGHEGVTDAVIKFMDKAFDSHELIKVKFNKFKDEKDELINMLAEATGSEVAGQIGNTAILYRMHKEKDKRKIVLP